MEECNELEVKMAAKEAETEEIPGQTQYGEYVQTLRRSLQEQKAAEAYLADAQAAQDYATYIVTLGGDELQETTVNPLVTQLLAHAQDLRMKAKEKVTMTTMPCCKQNQVTTVCFKSLAPHHSINQLFLNRKHLR